MSYTITLMGYPYNKQDFKSNKQENGPPLFY